METMAHILDGTGLLHENVDVPLFRIPGYATGWNLPAVDNHRLPGCHGISNSSAENQERVGIAGNSVVRPREEMPLHHAQSLFVLKRSLLNPMRITVFIQILDVCTSFCMSCQPIHRYQVLLQLSVGNTRSAEKLFM